MKIIDLEQGSKEWLSWRKTVITATECSIIMGSNPWATPYLCWGRKLGLIPEQKSNSAMEKGTRLEPQARAHFMDRYGMNMAPMVVESTDHDFLGASLDGISPCKRFLLEIKCGEAAHSAAKQGLIPLYYMHQMQHQMLVTGAEKCYYYSYDGSEGIRMEVYRDPIFAEEYMPKAREFWRCVAFSEPPALQEKDYKSMEENSDWQLYSKQYQEIDFTIKKLEQHKESLRKQLIGLCEDQNCSGNGIKIMKTTMKGRISYDEIPELKEVDLEKHRKPSTISWKILCSEKKAS